MRHTVLQSRRASIERTGIPAPHNFACCDLKLLSKGALSLIHNELRECVGLNASVLLTTLLAKDRQAYFCKAALACEDAQRQISLALGRAVERKACTCAARSTKSEMFAQWATTSCAIKETARPNLKVMGQKVLLPTSFRGGCQPGLCNTTVKADDLTGTATTLRAEPEDTTRHSDTAGSKRGPRKAAGLR